MNASGTAQPSSSPVPYGLGAVVLGVAIVIFLPALTIGFLADDFVYIARFREMPWSAWPRLFTQEWSGGVWGQPLKELRPFAALSLMIDARLWGGNVVGYRLVNLAFHLATTALVTRLAWRYGGGNTRVALIAGLAFAVHPSHVETVSWITGRPDLLGTFAALAFFCAGESFSSSGGKGRAAVALVAFFVGVFTKEFCLMIPVLLFVRWALLDLRAGRDVWLRRGGLFLGVIAVVVVYAWARRAAFGSDPTTGFFGWNDEPAWARQAAYWGWLLPFLPFTTGAEWGPLPRMSVLRSLWIAVAAIVALALGLAVRRRKPWGNAVFFGAFWWFATTLGLFVAVYFSPRHLYLPTAGVAIGVGLALHRGRTRAWIAFVALAACVAGHFATLQAWREAGRISREVLTSIESDLAAADDSAVVLISVPERFGPVLLWAWSSPQALGAPFLSRPVPPERILERVVNYVRADRWLEEHRPLEMMQAATSAVAVHVGPDGRVHHRRLSGAQLQFQVDQLAVLMAQGINAESLSAWLKACALP